MGSNSRSNSTTASHVAAPVRFPRGSTAGLGTLQPVQRKDISKVKEVDTIIIGNGPSALFLSYLLHGNEPRYTSSNPHPDTWLHKKLTKSSPDVSLYSALSDPAACDALTSHFGAIPSMSYSSQALPVNTLVDTLLRPLADIAVDSCIPRVSWKKSASVSHVILGEEKESGGQWAGDEIWFGAEGESDEEGDDQGIRTLSYADMLSLPGYSVMDHYAAIHNGKVLKEFVRPSRRLVASYYAAYPKAVGITDSIYPGVSVLNVREAKASSPFKFAVTMLSKSTGHKTIIRPIVVYCNNIVLASGIFSHTIPPPPEIAPLLSLNPSSRSEGDEDLPMLVLGSGYTAADAILCNEPTKNIIHVYKWNPEVKPSPLKGCHPQAYPNYARIHRQMKDAAAGKSKSKGYEGFGNAVIEKVDAEGRVWIRTNTGEVVERKVAGLKVGIGRRGRIDYLSVGLQEEIGLLPHDITTPATPTENGRRLSVGKKELWVRASSLRKLVEENIEVAPNVFVIGSLTGDSLVRYAMGGCVYTAGRVLGYDRERSEAKVRHHRRVESFESIAIDDEVDFTNDDADDEFVIVADPGEESLSSEFEEFGIGSIADKFGEGSYLEVDPASEEAKDVAKDTWGHCSMS